MEQKYTTISFSFHTFAARIIKTSYLETNNTMKKQLLMTTALALMAIGTTAQSIDFDLPGKTTPGKDTEINYISWAVPRAQSDTKTFDNGMTITITAGGAAADVGSSWHVVHHVQRYRWPASRHHLQHHAGGR